MSFLQRICKTLLYKRMGWTAHIEVDHPEKYILCLAPHTSNWDFIIGLLYSRAEGIKANFLMKKEWFFWCMFPPSWWHPRQSFETYKHDRRYG